MNSNLHAAKKAKNDEFYTQLSDIENELKHYKAHFKGKTVFLNCDDPQESNFYVYFAQNFEHLGLKKLISTHYRDDQPTYKLEIVKDENNDGKINALDTVKTPLKQNGDFRSDEAIAILEESDIVVTNPPFSLFREYISQLMEFNKKFIIVGNNNAISYKDIFPFIEDNRLWMGVNGNKTMEFKVPEGYKAQRIDDNGDKFVNVPAVSWFTNIPHKKRNEELVLYKEYNSEDYPKYDNYDAIEVSKVVNIPVDYDGIMGVPITFLNKYNPAQFKIIGLSQKTGYGLESAVDYKDYRETRQDGTETGSSGKKTNGNAVLEGKLNKGNYFVNGDKIVRSLYGRIFIIKRK